jgi:AcrR family transcriptional regulator
MGDPRRDRSVAAALQASRDLLLSEGWDALTHARVAELSGIGRATVYRNWPDQKGLLHDTLRSMVGQPAAHCVTGDVRTDLVQCLESLRLEMRDERYVKLMSTLINRSEWDPDVAIIRKDLALTAGGPLRRVLSDARDRGALPADLGLDVAVSCLAGPLMFRRFMLGVVPSRVFVAEIVEGFLAAFHKASPFL